MANLELAYFYFQIDFLTNTQETIDRDFGGVANSNKISLLLSMFHCISLF